MLTQSRSAIVTRLMAKRARATTHEVGGSHAISVSSPKAVAEIIEKAAKGAKG